MTVTAGLNPLVTGGRVFDVAGTTDDDAAIQSVYRQRYQAARGSISPEPASSPVGVIP